VKLAIYQQTFKGNFGTWNKTFDHELPRGWAATFLQLGILQHLLYSRIGGGEFVELFARITPRLAERKTGFNTHGYEILSAIASSSSSNENN